MYCRDEGGEGRKASADDPDCDFGVAMERAISIRMSPYMEEKSLTQTY